MKEIDKEILENLTLQCKIDLPQEDVERFTNEMEKILEFAHQLDELDTKDVDPCYHVLGDMKNVFRKDEPKNTLDKELLLANAPDHISSMIKIPKVFQEGNLEDMNHA